jgi:Tfp pilus assembly protein PilP
MLVLFSSCGGGPGNMPRPAPQGGESVVKPEAEKKEVKSEDAWSALEPYFNQFMDQSITEFKDPFKLQIVKHVGKKDLLEQLTALRPLEGADTATRGPEIPKGPLQRFGVNAYRPIIIMTGVSEPKAVLESPKGQTFVVTRDTYVGTEGGFVEDLTQYHVVFRVPGLDEPVIKSLKPELMERIKFDMGNQLQLQPDL